MAVLQGKPGRTHCFLLEGFGCSLKAGMLFGYKEHRKKGRDLGAHKSCQGQLVVLTKAEIYLGQGWCWSAEPRCPHADLHGLPGHPGKKFSCISLLGRQAQGDHSDLIATGKFPLSLFTSSPSILLLQHRCHHIQKSCAVRGGLSLLERARSPPPGGLWLFVETPARRSSGSWLIHQSHPTGPFSYSLPASPPKAARCGHGPWVMSLVSRHGRRFVLYLEGGTLQ